MTTHSRARSYRAGGDILPSRFVRGDDTAAYTVLQAGANSQIVGVSQPGTRAAPIAPTPPAFAASAGDPITVFADGAEDVLLELGGTVEPFDELKSDAQGRGVKITAGTTTQNIGAMALEGGGLSELIRVRVHIEQAGQTAASS